MAFLDKLGELARTAADKANDGLEINRINSDLANDLGNLLSRTVAMCEKYFGGTVHHVAGTEAIDAELETMTSELLGKVTADMA